MNRWNFRTSTRKPASDLMIARLTGLALVATALAVGGSAPVWAERAALQAACFPPAELAARAGERNVLRMQRPGDTGPPDHVVPAATGVLPPRGAIRRVTLPAGRKLIALTFDFCEQPGEVAGYDGAIIDFLRANRIKATLFVGGRWMTTHPARTEQLIADPLFEIASHGWAHRNVRLLNGDALSREIQGPSKAYAIARERLSNRACAKPLAGAIASVPNRIDLFRFPFGACNAAALDAVHASGMAAVQWDVSTGDPWPGQSAQAIADVIVRNARSGSIILAHANGRGHNTAAALPIAVPKLKALGFQFVTVGELLEAGKPVITDTCYDSRPGDTDKYDTFGVPAGRRKGATDGWATSTVPR